MAGKPKSMEVRAIELKQKYNLQQDVKLIENTITPFYPMKPTMVNPMTRWLVDMFNNFNYQSATEYIEHYTKIVNFTGKRTENREWYSLLYTPELVNEKLSIKSNRVKGENNPGYQHNGKLSKWSKNFKNGYDESAHEKFKQSHSDFQTDNKNNMFSRAYYNSDDEYSNAQRRDLDYFINKYGEEEGTKRYNAKTERWLKSLDNLPQDVKDEYKARAMKHRTESKGIEMNDLCIFYILKLPTQHESYKIGITSSGSTKARYGKYFYLCDVMFEHHGTINECFSIEQSILKSLSCCVIQKDDAIEGFGWTETLNCEYKTIKDEFDTLFEQIKKHS